MVKEVALITGGTSGIGKAQVYRWVQEGYDVVFCGRSEDKGTAIATETGAHYIKCDVSSAEDVEKMVQEIREKYQRLDVLFNNAGVAPDPTKAGRLADISNDSYRKIQAINMDGLWFTLKYCLKLMIEGGRGGRVVNMGSLTGITGCAAMLGISQYGTFKTAVVGMTKTAAIEYLPENIRINAVAPCGISTEMIRTFIAQAPDDQKQHVINTMMATNPMMKSETDMAAEDDVTGVVSFLCGPDAKYINGQTIAIDGGYSAK